MLHNWRVWLYAAGGWLILAGIAHLGWHVWAYVMEQGMIGQTEFAMSAMKQALSTDPLQPSLWGQFRVFSASFGLLLLFAGCIDVVLAWTRAPRATTASFALFGTLFWTVAFLVFVAIDPVIQPILVSAVAVPMHTIAWLTATHGKERQASAARR